MLLLAIGILLLISLLPAQRAHGQRARIVSAPPVTDAINADPFAEIMRRRDMILGVTQNQHLST